MVRHARACPRFSIITKQQCLWEELSYLFVAWIYASMEATSLSCRFSWVWPGMPKVLCNDKSQYLWKGLSDFVDFLQVICILLDIHWSYKNILVWLGTVRHSHSANEIFRCFKLQKPKTIWSMNLILCFHWS